MFFRDDGGCGVDNRRIIYAVRGGPGLSCGSASAGGRRPAGWPA